MYGLVNSFDHCVSLGVVSGYQLSAYTILFAYRVLHFCSELSSPVHDNLRWPWVSSQPQEFEIVDNAVSSFRGNFADLEPSGCGIDHCEAVKGDLFLLLADGVWTDEVDTERVPGYGFGLLGRKKASLLAPFLGRGTDGACARHLLDGVPHPLPVVVLSEGQLHASFPWMAQVCVIPLRCRQLQSLRDDDLIILVDDQFVGLI